MALHATVATPVIAIVGAGASHVSGTYATDQRPPLTRSLFEGSRSEDLLKIYTLARAAGTVIRREMAVDNAVAFEAALRRIQEDGFAHHLQMALAVAPYLQALLLEYSEVLRADAFRYSVLVDEMLKLPTSVHFVSLNYPGAIVAYRAGGLYEVAAKVCYPRGIKRR